MSEGVENARIAAAERQFEPPPEQVFPFDIAARSRLFDVFLPTPAFFTGEWTSPPIARIVKANGEHWTVHAAPWASLADVSAALDEMVIPF
jgi:hypothetical protein